MEHREKAGLVEKYTNICAPEDPEAFVRDLKCVLAASNEGLSEQALQEFVFEHCFSSGDRSIPARPSDRSQKRKRGGTVFAEGPVEHAGSAISALFPKKKSARVAELLFRAVSRCAFIAALDQEIREKIVAELVPFFVLEGTPVIHENTPGEYFSVIFHGAFDVFYGNEYQATLRPGSIFGEVALLHDAPRTGTVVAGCDSTIFCIDRTKFKSIVFHAVEQERMQRRCFLEQTGLFKALSEINITTLSEALVGREYPAGASIVSEGDEGDLFFIIKEGAVEITRHESGGLPIAVLGPGDYLGEVALLQGCRRTATATAQTPVKCLMIGRELFRRLFGEGSQTGRDFTSVHGQGMPEERLR